MKFQEYKNSPAYDADLESYCKHCLRPFKDTDDIGRCEQTDHLTHAICVKHSA
ncbi:MAG: hypothetical protein ACYC7D_13735 [Nitrososphaerales archaeon]